MEADAAIHEALERGDIARAAELTVKAYGTEVRSFLSALHGHKAEGAEVFAQACEDLVRSFAAYRGECRVRTWFFALAKNASHRYFADTYRRRRMNLSDAPEPEAAARTGTSPFLQTEYKNRLRALRDELTPEDRALLILRVDRQMAWDDIARVLAPESAPSLRKRFERIKAKLRDSARRDGWPVEH